MQRTSRVVGGVAGVGVALALVAGALLLWQTLRTGDAAGPIGGEPPVSSGPSPEQTTITLAAPDGSFDAYRDLAAEFEGLHPDVHVQVVSLEEILAPDLKDSASPQAALRVMSAADTAWWYIQPDATRQGLVRDLGPFLDADPGFDAADFYPGLLDAYRWDGGLWAVPGRAMVTLVYYDRAAFDEAGVPYPQAGWTWDEFVATARAVTKWDGDEVARYGYVDLVGGIWDSYLADQGILAEVRSADPSTLRLDSPGVAAAMRRYVEGDCFRFTTGSITPGEAQYLLSLDPLLNATASFPRDDYYPSFWQMCEQGGQLWCLPYDGRVGVVHYNKALFDAAGVPYPQPEWTLDDLVVKALALTKGEGADKQYGFSGYTNEELALAVVLRLRGGALWDTAASPPRPQFGDPAVVDAVRWYGGLAGDDGIRPVVHLNLPWDQMLKETQPAIYLVEGGKVAMWTQYADTDPYLQRAIPSMDTIPFPRYKGHSTFAALAESHYISAQTEYPQACWDWLAFLGEQVAAVTGAPVRRSLVESAAFQQHVGADIADAYLAALQASDPTLVLGAQPSWMGSANRWFYEAYDAVLDGGDAEQALGEAQRKATAFVTCIETHHDLEGYELAQACALEVDSEYPTYSWDE